MGDTRHIIYSSREVKVGELHLPDFGWSSRVSPSGPVPGHLWWDGQGLFLASSQGLWRPDFKDYAHYWQGQALVPRKEPLGRALGIELGKSLKIFDASLGAGRDAFLLLYWGQEVFAAERNPLVFALLGAAARDFISSGHPLAFLVEEKLHLFYGEATQAFPGVHFHRLYFDPMFPDLGRKTSALSGKGMESLKFLLKTRGEQREEEREVFLKLWQRCPHVVVKRGLRSPPLHPAVNAQWRGKTLRFDKYLR